jgi:uncharacterized integral membrane protein
MKLFKVIILLALILAAIVFASQNSTEVTVTFFGLSGKGPQSLILMVTLAVGVFIGILVMAPSLFRHSSRSAGFRRKIATLEKENQNQNNSSSER